MLVLVGGKIFHLFNFIVIGDAGQQEADDEGEDLGNRECQPHLIECADAAHGLGGQIISDGGCTMPGDVAKAFGGGADFVMLGGMLAGHEESGGTIVEENGEKFMLFYGMSSESAMTRHVGGVAKYRAAEGKTVKLPLRGPVENTARDILGGLRSACTYVGASRLKELTKRTTFIRVQEQENRVFNSL